MYFSNLLPGLVKEGDDGNYGSSAVCDTICLQVNFYAAGTIVCFTRMGHSNTFLNANTGFI